MDELYIVLLDKVVVKCEGFDVIIIFYGYMVCESLNVVEDLVKEGINVEVFDFCIVFLFDEEMILNEVKKIGCVVLV